MKKRDLPGIRSDTHWKRSLVLVTENISAIEFTQSEAMIGKNPASEKAAINA